MNSSNSTYDQASEQTNSQLPLTVIRPPRRLEFPSFRELWSYRELLFFLIIRDIKARLKHTALGVGWVLVPPVLQMVVFSAILGGAANLPSDGMPYPILVYSGLIIWSLFAKGMEGASQSLLTGANIANKVHFPRLIMTLSAVLSPLLDFFIAGLVLCGLMAYYGIVPSWEQLAVLPAMVLLALLTSWAVGVWLAALSVRYRDVRYATSFLSQMWMFVSPVVYATSLIPPGIWKTAYWLNPPAIFVQGFRWSLTGLQPPPWETSGVVAGMVLIVLAVGLVYFSKVEKTYVDFV